MNDEAVTDPIETEAPEVPESADTDEEWLAKRNKEIAARDDDDDDDIAESEEAVAVEEIPEPSESSTEKKGDGFQKRIDELTQRYYTEKQQREHFQKQWEESRPKVEIQPEGKTLADFDYDEGKFAEYIQGQAVVKARAEIDQANKKQAAIKRRAEFEAREASFASKVDDYHTVTRNQSLPITQSMVASLATAEKGPEVLYYLGKNPGVARSLSAMNPLDAARELGRIEATKLVKPEPSQKKSPAAAVPKIKAASTSTERIKPDSPKADELSDEEWLKRRRKQLASR
jgi:hypothetical protein